jgi:beta-glucosidase/6-phospho-beta-glucosidase/beta-galactosidase
MDCHRRCHLLLLLCLPSTCSGYYVWAPEAGAPKNQVFTLADPLSSPGIPTNAAWLFKTPDGLRNTLVWLNKRYNAPEFWITENGVSGPGEEFRGRDHAVRDDFRLDYYK